MIAKPRGTVDLYGPKMREVSALKLILRNIMDIYNYQEIETPIFESLELFKRAVGEQTDIVSKEMFAFQDKKNREMVLRPEGTASTVRMLVEDKLYQPDNLPLKFYYIGQMFRYERPQSGRQRQFSQFGVEVFGSDDYTIDVEIISLAMDILRQIRIENTICHINFLVTGDERKKYVADLKKTLQGKPLCDDCKNRIEQNPLRVLDCKIDGSKFGDLVEMNNYLSKDDKMKFEHIKKVLLANDIKYVVDKNLVRGLDYYDGIVFEIISLDEKAGAQSTLIGGGRYNNLVSSLGGPSLPAIGFAIGLERLLIALENAKITLAQNQTLDAYIISLSEKSRQASLFVGAILRQSGISCDIDHLNKNLKAAFKAAERQNAQHIIIIGDEELKLNILTIKDQASKIESKVKFSEIVKYFEN